MRKLFAILLALFMAVTIQGGAFCAEGDELTTNSFRVDGNGEVYYQVLTEIMSTNDTVTAAESGKVFLMSGSSSSLVLATLPAADEGLIYTFVSINTDDEAFQINPNGTDRLLYSTAAAGNRIRSAGSMGNGVTVYASDDTSWAVNPNSTFTVNAD